MFKESQEQDAAHEDTNESGDESWLDHLRELDRKERSGPAVEKEYSILPALEEAIVARMGGVRSEADEARRRGDAVEARRLEERLESLDRELEALKERRNPRPT